MVFRPLKNPGILMTPGQTADWCSVFLQIPVLWERTDGQPNAPAI